jgi:hypothetical protein
MKQHIHIETKSNVAEINAGICKSDGKIINKYAWQTGKSGTATLASLFASSRSSSCRFEMKI